MSCLDDKRCIAVIVISTIVVSFLFALLILSVGDESNSNSSNSNQTLANLSASTDSTLENANTAINTNSASNTPSKNGNSNQIDTASKNPASNTLIQKESTTPTESRPKVMRDGFKVMADNSQTLIGWCLAIFGATILALISSSYIRPPNKDVRLIYLLFIPGWIFIGFSAYCGNLLARYYMVAIQKFSPKESELILKLRDAGWYIDFAYGKQLLFLQIGLIVFAVWILIFLVWWIFKDGSVEEEEEIS
jgi:hypothetical protein